MKLWQVNTSNNFKIISDSPDFKLYYLKDDDDEFIEIHDQRISFGDNLYVVSYTFDEVGKYIIKIKHNDDIAYNELYVVEHEEFMRLNTEYAVKYSGASLVFN